MCVTDITHTGAEVPSRAFGKWLLPAVQHAGPLLRCHPLAPLAAHARRCDFARYVSIKAGTTATLSCPGILVIGPDVRPYWGKPDSSDPKCNATGLYQ